MTENGIFYQDISIEKILNKYSDFDLLFGAEDVIKDIIKSLFENFTKDDIVNEDGIVSELNKFIKKKSENQYIEDLKFDIENNIFERLSGQKKEQFIINNLGGVSFNELSKLLEKMTPNKEFLNKIYTQMSINDFIQLINLLLNKKENVELFSKDELSKFIKKVKIEDLPKIINCSNIVMASDEILEWYKDNCVIEKISDYVNGNIHGINIINLSDASINLLVQLAKEKDINNLLTGDLISKLLSVKGESQDIITNNLINDFNVKNFLEMLNSDSFLFTKNLTENNCKKILNKLGNNIDFSKVDINKFFSLLNKINDLEFKTYFYKKHNASLILYLCNNLDTMGYGNKIEDVLKNIFEGMGNNSEELIGLIGLEYMRKKNFGNSKSTIKYVLKQALSDDSFIKCLSEGELIEFNKNFDVDSEYIYYIDENISVIKYFLKKIFSDNEFVDSLTDEEIKYIYLKDVFLTSADLQQFIKFYRSLNNNPNISQAADFFIEYPYFSVNYINNIIDENELKKILNTSYLNFIYEYFDNTKMPQEVQTNFEDLKEFISNKGKINTLEVNPVVSYDFIKYIYKNLGLDFSSELSKYNTFATKELIETIKNGEIELVKFYIELYEKYNLFKDDDKKINLAFMHFSSFKELLKDIKDKNQMLDSKCLTDLKNIILSGNRFNINSIDDLFEYKIHVNNHFNKVLENNNIFEIKDNISLSFGFSFVELERQFNGYELSNFSKINDILKQLSVEDYEKLKLNQKDTKLIILVKNIIECDDLEKLKNILRSLMKDGEVLDFQNDFNNIVDKIKEIYCMAFNSKFTDISTLSSPKDTESIPGVTIIDLNGESFNFYAHRLFGYDVKFSSYSRRLEEDPSLWTKLEGASTLSTSCISDKGLHFLQSNNPNGVVYLFNNIPTNGMLYMCGSDLVVQHGGHAFAPTCNDNKFTDLDSLVQSTNYCRCEYNELALFREGIMPCAFACIGDTPNESTIRAAKYFSELLKRDIPIIKLNPELYKNQNQIKREGARKNFSENANINDLKEIFYDGKGEIEEKIDFCLNILKNQYQNGILEFKEYVRLLAAMQSFVDKTYNLAGNKIIKRKLQLLRQSICIMGNLTEEEIIEIETANLGESRIMYKFKENNKEYLLKPSVEKESLRNQPFRAEIQKAAGILQAKISPDTAVDVNVLSEGSLRIAQQELINVSDENKFILNEWYWNGGYLPSNYTNQLLQEYVVDFLLCNFDCYSGNFIVDSNNNIRGIDKEQSFRFIQDSATLDPSFSYAPNGRQRIPIYYKLFEEYRNGRLDLNLEVINDCISKVEAISHEEYKKIFEKYADSLDPENKQMILDKILQRKIECTQILKEYIIELQNSRNEGVNL